MIDAGVEFGKSAPAAVLEALLSLPDALRPTLWGEGEDCIDKPISTGGELAERIGGNGTGALLKNAHVTYDVRRSKAGALLCYGYFEEDPGAALDFLAHMAGAGPEFGFACSPAEYEARNRIVTTQGENKIESWVGRDWSRYVPGLYWATLLTEALAEQHGVPLSALRRVAREERIVGQHGHLFRFYDRPDDWSNTGDIAALCATVPGFFHIDEVRPGLAEAKTVLEMAAVMRRWP